MLNFIKKKLQQMKSDPARSPGGHAASAGSAPPINKQLVGRWKLVRSDPPRDMSDELTIVFKDDGSLLYITRQNRQMQSARLTYTVLADTIVTNQPDRQREEITVYSFDASGNLVLEHNNTMSWYERTE